MQKRNDGQHHTHMYIWSEVYMMILKSITVGQTKVLIHDESILQDKKKIEQTKEQLNRIALDILKKHS